jgi:hypothetical protein
MPNASCLALVVVYCSSMTLMTGSFEMLKISPICAVVKDLVASCDFG